MAEIYDKAVEFRDALLKRERQAASILVRSYGQSWNKIQKLLARVTAQIDDAQRRGLTISPAWLFQQERYQQLILQIEREITKFAHVLDAQVKKEQSAAIRAAARNTVELAAAAQTPGTVAAGFTKLSPAAIESITAFVQEGTPLGRLLAELPRGAGQAVADALVEAVSLGYNPIKTARIIRREMGMTLTRALTIARTETLRAYREATHRSYQANDDLATHWVWISSQSRRTCAACLALHGQVFPITERQSSHVRCLLPGQVVHVPSSIRALTRRWVEGQAVHIRTESGAILAVTENHPILTPQGWVAAGLLKEGGYVVSSDFPERTLAAVNPHDNYVPSLIEEVWESFSRLGNVSRRVMPASAENFHGDGEGSEVEIIFINGQLGTHLNPAILQPSTEQQFFSRGVPQRMLFANRAPNTFLYRNDAGFSGQVGSSGISPMLFRCAAGHHQLIRLDNGSSLDSVANQEPRNDGPRDLQGIGDLLLGHPALIPANSLHGNGSGSDIVANAHASFSQQFLQRPVTDAEHFAQSRTSVARFIKFDQIREIVQRPFSSHVYNLETQTGWYICNDIIAHNCRCTSILLLKGQPNPITESGETWLKKQPDEIQRTVLGTKAGFDRFQSGELTLQDFVGLQRSPQWGDSYVQLSVKRALNGEARFPKFTLPTMPTAPTPAPFSPSIGDLKPKYASIEFRGNAKQTIQSLFGRDVDGELLAAASGALDGSKIRILDVSRDRLEIEVSHPEIALQVRQIYKDEKGKLTISNYIFSKKEGVRPGIGLEMLDRQVQFASDLGINRLRTEAAGNRYSTTFNGYYTWPRLGYNAKLDADWRRELPPSLKSARSVLDLMDTEEGRQWWRENGNSMLMDFDLKPGSRSRQILEAYKQSKKR